MQNNFYENIFINPGKLFLVVWFFSTILYLLNLSDQIIPSSFYSVTFLLFCVFITSIFGLSNLSIHFKNEKKIYVEHKQNIYTIILIFSFLLIWEIVHEIKYFGTLPFFASYSFDNVGYNDIAPIFKFRHNFFVKANTIFLSGYLYFLYHFFNRKKIFLIGFILVSATSLLYISRSTMISISVITIIIYLYFRKIRYKQLLLFVIILIIASYIFDKLYFLRNQYDIKFYTTQYEEHGFWSSVIRGLEEIYVYIASPVSNLLYNIERGTFTLFNFTPSYIIRSFLPAQASTFLFGEIDFNDTIYIPKTANTFTTFPPFFFAFGLVGSLFGFAFIGKLLKFTYYRAVKNPARWFLVIVFLNHIVILSIFSFSFINLVFFFPIIISYIFPPVKLSKTL